MFAATRLSVVSYAFSAAFVPFPVATYSSMNICCFLVGSLLGQVFPFTLSAIVFTYLDKMSLIISNPFLSSTRSVISFLLARSTSDTSSCILLKSSLENCPSSCFSYFPVISSACATVSGAFSYSFSQSNNRSAPFMFTLLFSWSIVNAITLSK
jgi:hypothetical protein